jgi:Domain of unknown function (DUF1990)
MGAELATRLAAADLTYGAVGATDGALPPGFHHLRASRLVGSGPDAFASAVSALAGWQVHRRAGPARYRVRADSSARCRCAPRPWGWTAADRCPLSCRLHGDRVAAARICLRDFARTSGIRRGSLRRRAPKRRSRSIHDHRILPACDRGRPSGRAGRAHGSAARHQALPRRTGRDHRVLMVAYCDGRVSSPLSAECPGAGAQSRGGEEM